MGGVFVLADPPMVGGDSNAAVTAAVAKHKPELSG